MKQIKNNGFTPVEIIIVLFVIALLGITIWLFSDVQEQDDNTAEPTPTPTVVEPTQAMEVTPTLEVIDDQNDTPTPTPTPDPTSDWLTYTNETYGYTFKYPQGATITEAQQSEFSMTSEEVNQGMTFEQLYNEYGPGICVSVTYGLGYAHFSAAENETTTHVMCHRSGVAYTYDSVEQPLIIDGQSYTATGLEEHGPGETLDMHNETLSVTINDGNAIEFGSTSNQTNTYQEYVDQSKDTILLIVQSYQAL